jgi:hypothetical protein
VTAERNAEVMRRYLMEVVAGGDLSVLSEIAGWRRGGSSTTPASGEPWMRCTGMGVLPANG